MALAETMLDDGALRATGDGFELEIHLNWYRSLPLSSVKTVELTLDGEPVARDEMTFAVGGREYALDDLPNHWEEIWFVLDPATVRVRGRLLERGREVEVTLRRGNRIPYILIGPGIPLEYVSELTKTLVVR